MKLTAQLKAFFVSKGWCAAADSDDKFRAVASAKLLSGELTSEQFAALSKDAAPSGEKRLESMVAGMVSAAVAPLVDALKTAGVPVATPAPAPTPTPTPTPTPDAGGQQIAEMVADGVRKEMERLGITTGGGAPGGGMNGILSRSGEILSRPQARVKMAVEQYTHSRRQAVYPERTLLGSKHLLAGQPATHAGVVLEHPSDRDKAVSAAYFKFALSKSSRPEDIPYGLKLTDHDMDLLQWAVRNSSWSGLIRGVVGDEPGCVSVNRRRLTEAEYKALLDDTTSGGIEIAPIEFDDALVTTPVLYGEFFPLVSVTSITRGRRIKGGSVTNPTFTSGVAEGTAITPFNTSSFVGAFDTTIFTAVAAMEIGLDFEEDSPTNIGQIIIQKYGEKALEWLDRVIAVGDGLIEPQGFFNSSGAVSVSTDFDLSGPPTVGDYEALMFGVAKQFRTTKGSRNVFAGSDTSYRRARGIPVGPGDERRVMGMDHASYTLLDHPYKVNNNIPNNKTAFVNLGYYRMYRRIGMNVRIETQGQSLALKNTKLIVVRMRYGGQLELGGAAAISTNAAS